MYQKIGLKMATSYSPNFNLPKRAKNRIKFIIIHYTGMKKESAAIKRLQDPKSKVSAHYLIKNNGVIINLVPDLYEAWHAGVSSWKHFTSLNKNSIGIEISNPGHQHGYKNFNKKQIYSLIKLSKKLIKKYPIKNKYILGHSDIAPLRKKDPGEKFPWKILSKKNIGIWHKYKKKIKNRFIDIKSTDLKNEFFLNLRKYGYSINSKNLLDKRKIIKVFQMRFRPEKVNGIIDFETYNILKTLN